MPKPAVTGTLLSAGCDWLTATQAPGARCEMMTATARQVIDQEAASGQIVRDWQWQGYTGEATRDFAYGRRHDGAIVRLHGATAYHHWARFARLAKNISRFDVQCTVMLDPPAFPLGAMHREEAIASRLKRGAAVSVSSIDTHEGGYTLYIGRRASDVLTRVYDKSAESPDLYPTRGAWRYEVEWKRAPALVAVRKLLDARDAGAMMLAMLADHLEGRGLTPAFPSLTRERVRAPAARSDVATRLRWLEASVRPAIDWLIEHGHGADVWGILGAPGDTRRKEPDGHQ